MKKSQLRNIIRESIKELLDRDQEISVGDMYMWNGKTAKDTGQTADPQIVPVTKIFTADDLAYSVAYDKMEGGQFQIEGEDGTLWVADRWGLSVLDQSDMGAGGEVSFDQEKLDTKTVTDLAINFLLFLKD